MCSMSTTEIFFELVNCSPAYLQLDIHYSRQPDTYSLAVVGYLSRCQTITDPLGSRTLITVYRYNPDPDYGPNANALS